MHIYLSHSLKNYIRVKDTTERKRIKKSSWSKTPYHTLNTSHFQFFCRLWFEQGGGGVQSYENSVSVFSTDSTLVTVIPLDKIIQYMMTSSAWLGESCIMNRPGTIFGENPVTKLITSSINFIFHEESTVKQIIWFLNFVSNFSKTDSHWI